MEYKYKTIFSSTLCPANSKDKYLLTASVDKLKSFLPEIDIERDYDLLPYCANAAVINRINKNSDGITTETALKAYKSFISRGTNLEHNRKVYVGCILKSGFSEFGTDKPLKDEDVKSLTKPFNLTVGGVVWKVVSENLIDYLEETNDPSSKLYNDASISWEVGFSEFDIVAFKEQNQKNIEDGRIISDPQEVEKLAEYLTANDGSGQISSGEYIYRLAKNITFLGVGITTSPAADVKGILVGITNQIEGLGKTESQKIIKKFEDVDSKMETSILELAANIKNIENKISQTEKPIVKENTDMNIKKVEDITDENLKEIKASTIRDFIVTECAKISEDWAKEKKAKEGEFKAAEEANKTLTEKSESLKNDLETVKKNLEKLQAEATEKEKVEKYNQRMAHFDNIYELDDDIRKILASQLKDADEEGFKKLDDSYKVLLKDKNKETIEAAKKKVVKKPVVDDPEDKKDKGVDEDIEDKNGKKVAKASVIDETLKNAEKEKADLPNRTSTETPTLMERAKKAFAVGKDGVIVNFSKVRKF